MEWIKRNKWFLIVGGSIILALILYFTTKSDGKKIPTTNPDGSPDLSPCNPRKSGYTMNGNWSMPCAGGTPNFYNPTCADNNKSGLDINGNFFILCAGGAPTNPPEGWNPNNVKCVQGCDDNNKGNDCDGFPSIDCGFGRIKK